MEPFLGQIAMFGGNFAPRGWAFCDGQILNISSNSALFSIFGTTYGGDGRTTFGLPDLRGRSPLHAGTGTGAGLPGVKLGDKSGKANSTLPEHTHTAKLTVRVSTETGDSDDPDNAVIGSGSEIYTEKAPDTDMKAGSVGGNIESAGVSPTNTNYHPNLAINFIVALVGIYPSRN